MKRLESRTGLSGGGGGRKEAGDRATAAAAMCDEPPDIRPVDFACCWQPREGRERGEERKEKKRKQRTDDAGLRRPCVSVSQSASPSIFQSFDRAKVAGA